MALEIVKSSAQQLEDVTKWRIIGDRALVGWKVDLATECFKMAKDFSALLLIYTSTGDRNGLESLSAAASKSFVFILRERFTDE